jgi:hypothetical protein
MVIATWWWAVMCRLGIHRWESWRVLFEPVLDDDIEKPERAYIERRCRNCDAAELL